MNMKALKPFLLGTVSAVVFAFPAVAQDSDALETVTVTGYRASLNKALEIKRDTVGVRDSIVAEDIGKFPATNIAESLLRVPGVVLSRDTRTDEGRQLTVRGLPAAYTVVTINGNPVHMETNGNVGTNARSVDLDAFGADLFSRVDFYKSPSARLDEGGIGGVIDLRTPHPFDYDGRQISYSVGYGMNSQRMKAVPTGTLQVSDTWGPFGALIAMTAKRSSYAFWGNETAGYSQGCNENGFMGNGEKYDFGPGKTGVCGTTTWAGVDSRANIGSYTIPQIMQAFIPRWGRDHLTMDDRTRYSGVLSLQYKPNDKFDMSLDVMGAELIDATNEYVIGTFFRSTGPTTAAGIATALGKPDPTTWLGKTSDTNGLVPLNVGIDSNDVLYGQFGNVQIQSGNVWYRGKDKFISGTFNARYQVQDDLTILAEAGIADYHGFIGTSTLNAYIYNTTLTYDPRDNYKFPTLISNVDLTNPALYQGNTTGTRNGFETSAQYLKEGDQVLTGRLAAQHSFESGVSAIGHVNLEFGVGWVANTKVYDQRNNGTLVRNATLSNGLTLGTMLPSANMVNHLKIDNYLDDVSNVHRITNWATVPDSVYYMVPWTNILAADTSNNWYPSVFKLTEGVTSFYLNASSVGEVLGRTLKVDVGIRYAVTRTWGYKYKAAIGTIPWAKDRLHSSYDNLLPTVSISYDVMDDLVLRASYGQTITRADLGSIAKGKSVPNTFNPNVAEGNPDLKPFTATNVDAGVEWYFDQGSVVSLGVFYKGIKNLISTQTTGPLPWSSFGLPDSLLAANQHINGDLSQPVDPNLPISFTHPVNLNPMVVKGFEVFYQQPFAFLPDPFDGLGAMASFTYTAGSQNGPGTGFTANDGTIYAMPLRGLSTYSYSATAYYEKDGISLRASYNWRSKAGADDSLDNLNYYKTNTRIWAAARGTLDVTAGYAFTDWAEVRFDVSNLLNSQEVAMLRDATGKDSKIGQRYSGFGDPNAHNFNTYVHGRNYMLSVRGHI